jgi:DNA mismatch repair protein MutL
MAQQKIRILDERTINQIAAGEVIENPASVVKELVENALDAGATDIVVETEVAGRGLIRVSDDGCGMDQDNLLLSVERHATSKLTSVDELEALQTLGFRGEALPSIASVSKMTLKSCSLDGKGSCLQIEGGRIEKFSPFSRCRGTTIEVKSLFFNVPVRKKFQKSIGWDRGEIHKVLTKFVLSYPSCGFSWINDTKQLMAFTPDDGGDIRIKGLLGEEFMHQSLPVEHERGNLSLCGRISRPQEHRPNRVGQYLFINQRGVASPWVAKKVVEGYGRRLPPHRYPLFVLHLTLPPSWIDVNVHPQKTEIRIREEEKLSAFILEALASSLELPEKAVVASPAAMDFPVDLPHFTVAEPVAEYHTSEEELCWFTSHIKSLGRVKHYLFVEEEEGIRVVDLASARERVLFDELSRRERKLETQALLLPIQLTVTGKERFLLSEHLQTLNEKGISIRHFGGDTFIVDAIPALLEPNEIPDFIYAYLEEGELPRHLEKCLKREEISTEAGKALVEKLFRSQNPDYTPSGKRIHLLLDASTLEKMVSSSFGGKRCSG